MLCVACANPPLSAPTASTHIKTQVWAAHTLRLRHLPIPFSDTTILVTQGTSTTHQITALSRQTTHFPLSTITKAQASAQLHSLADCLIAHKHPRTWLALRRQTQRIEMRNSQSRLVVHRSLSTVCSTDISSRSTIPPARSPPLRTRPATPQTPRAKPCLTRPSSSRLL